MRVLQFGKFYPPVAGGIERVMKDMTSGLNARGFKCDVLCSNDRYHYDETGDGDHVVMRTRSLGKIFSVSLSPQLVTKLFAVHGHYDIIHVHQPDPLAALALFIARPAGKIVLHWHSDIVRQNHLIFAFQPIQRWLLERADVIVATSQKYAERSFTLPHYSRKVAIVPPGIDARSLLSDPEAVRRIKAGWLGKKLVLAVGRLTGYKGFEYLIEATRYLEDEYAVAIIGDGPLRRKLARIIELRRLAGRVHLLGNLNDQEKASWYEACDVFCMSSVSRNEAFGLVLLEAMAFGKPLIATRIDGSGVDWVNVEGVTGYNVEVRNGSALAEAIRRITRNPELYSQLSRNCVRRFGALFTSDRMVQDIAGIYCRLMGPTRLEASKLMTSANVPDVSGTVDFGGKDQPNGSAQAYDAEVKPYVAEQKD